MSITECEELQTLQSKLEVRDIKDRQKWTTLDKLIEDLDGTFTIINELPENAGQVNGLTFKMSFDYWMLKFLTYIEDYSKSSFDFEFRFTVYDTEYEETVLVTNDFTITAAGQPNFCHDVEPQFTIVECNKLGLEPCPNELIYVQKDRLTFPNFGATSKQKARRLYKGEIANWWSYEVLNSDGNTFSYVNPPERAVQWSAKGADGNECQTLWEPTLKEAGSDNYIAYDVNNPLYKIIETVDKNSDYIEVGWANLVQPGVNAFEIYS